MPILPDLSARLHRPELMDDPGLDPAEHRRALAGLGRLNAVSDSAGLLWSRLKRLAEPGRTLKVLDVASGGGDVCLGLLSRARSAGVRVEVVGLDVSPTAVAHAADRCGGAAEFRRADVLREPLPGGFDVVTCSLFLHHLSEAEAIPLLGKMAAAGRAVLVNDLRRGRWGHLLAHAACRALTRSPVVREDGPASVAAAFTPAEMGRLFEAAGLAGVRVTRHFPARMLAAWGVP